MGGFGPYVEFVPERSSWKGSVTQPTIPSSDEINAAYIRAAKYLIDKALELKNQYGWTDVSMESEYLFHIKGTHSTEYHGDHKYTIVLPCTFAALVDPSKRDKWLWGIFSSNAKRRDGRFYIEAITQICDIFYILQSIAPGMLVIIRVDDYDDYGEVEYTQALPPSSWVQKNRDMLVHILGSVERYEALHDGSKNFPSCETTSSYYNQAGDEALDFTACDKECGYCGRCDYNDL